MNHFAPIILSMFWVVVIALGIFAAVTFRQSGPEKIPPKVAYLYFFSLISLIIAGMSVSYIWGVLIEMILSDPVMNFEEKKALSMALAFAVISLPVWAGHWYLASRNSRADAGVLTLWFREKYIYLVMGLSGVSFLVFVGWVVYKIFNKVLGISDFDIHFFSRFLGFALASLVIWLFHWYAVRK